LLARSHFYQKITIHFRISAGPLRFFFLLLLGAAGLAATSCKKDKPEIPDYSARDKGLITDYLASKNITTAQEQASGA
jgi:hypothetical protein